MGNREKEFVLILIKLFLFDVRNYPTPTYEASFRPQEIKLNLMFTILLTVLFLCPCLLLIWEISVIEIVMIV